MTVIFENAWVIAVFANVICGEKLVGEIDYNGTLVELVHCPATIWCGAVGYARDGSSEPEIEGLLMRYQAQCGIPKRERANPDWSCCISIDYWQNGAAPRGMCFAQQVLTEAQDAAHDVYVMPESLYLRAAATKENAVAIFGRDSCEVFELFGFLREVMAAEGYSVGDNGAQEIEMYNHEAGMAYAYVQVKEQGGLGLCGSRSFS